MFSVIMPDKSVQDIKYKIRTKNRTDILLGKICIGQIFKMGTGKYSVVVVGDIPHPLLRSMDGIRDYHHCTKFCLIVLGYWKPE